MFVQFDGMFFSCSPKSGMVMSEMSGEHPLRLKSLGAQRACRAQVGHDERVQQDHAHIVPEDSLKEAVMKMRGSPWTLWGCDSESLMVLDDVSSESMSRHVGLVTNLTCEKNCVEILFMLSRWMMMSSAHCRLAQDHTMMLLLKPLSAQCTR